MTRLIDADAMRNDWLENGQNEYVYDTNAFLQSIDEQPTIEAEPVRQGKWLPTNDENKKRCSRCEVIHLIAQYPNGDKNYCPNCGAKMSRTVSKTEIVEEVKNEPKR